MTPKNRVLAAVRGESPDRVPAAFWLHFPESMYHGEQAVKAHLDFLRADRDGHPQGDERKSAALPVHTTADDWRQVRPLSLKDPFVVDQLDIIKAVADAAGDETVVITTIHGVFASAFHTAFGRADYEAKRSGLAVHFREKPEVVKAAFEAIAEGLVALTEASLEAGAQGIYYAALGGERSVLTDEEFEELIKPLDLAILDAAEARRLQRPPHLQRSRQH